MTRTNSFFFIYLIQILHRTFLIYASTNPRKRKLYPKKIGVASLTPAPPFILLLLLLFLWGLLSTQCKWKMVRWYFIQRLSKENGMLEKEWKRIKKKISWFDYEFHFLLSMDKGSSYVILFNSRRRSYLIAHLIAQILLFIILMRFNIIEM